MALSLLETVAVVLVVEEDVDAEGKEEEVVVVVENIGSATEDEAVGAAFELAERAANPASSSFCRVLLATNSKSLERISLQFP